MSLFVWDYKKTLFTVLFSFIVLAGFAGSGDSVFAKRPPLPPKNKKLSPKIDVNRDGQLELANLVVFVRFADDDELTASFDDIDSMFNCSSPGAVSVYNYFNVMTYGKINYRSVFTNNIVNSVIVSFQDRHPRSYFEPYSESNPDGYAPFPVDSVCPRETRMIAEILHLIDSLNLVDEDVNLDGDNDGYIDNISFIIKGNVGNWAELLWPHMEFFKVQDADVPYTVSVNGKLPHAYNFEFENSGNYFSANVFSHEMGHSLGLPDLYHYGEYPHINPVGMWDQMASSRMQQVSTIIKSKFLDLVDEPVQITCDGTYTLNSNTSSDHQNCYYIKSAVDSTQWFTFEYRNGSDFMENVIESGLIIGRWVDTMDVSDLYKSGNGFFDFHNRAHGYWVFRPGSSIDTVEGYIYSAAFNQYGRSSFGPTTDPRPFLSDGTPENSFEITNISMSGDQLTFDVHFFNSAGVEDKTTGDVRVYPNPAKDRLSVAGDGVRGVEICDMAGRTLIVIRGAEPEINISSLSSGTYILKITGDNGVTVNKLVVGN